MSDDRQLHMDCVEQPAPKRKRKQSPLKVSGVLIDDPDKLLWEWWRVPDAGFSAKLLYGPKMLVNGNGVTIEAAILNALGQIEPIPVNTRIRKIMIQIRERGAKVQA